MTEQMNVSKDPDNREVVPIVQNIKVTLAITFSNRGHGANSLIASHRLLTGNLLGPYRAFLQRKAL